MIMPLPISSPWSSNPYLLAQSQHVTVQTTGASVEMGPELGCLELGCLELGPELGLDLECPLTQTECVNGWVGIG